MDREQTKQAILGFTEMFKAITGNQDLKIPSEIAEKYGIETMNYKHPKTGHWIIIDDCEHFIAKCSECGRREDSRMISLYPYCHCGAKMIEPQESEKK